MKKDNRLYTPRSFYIIMSKKNIFNVPDISEVEAMKQASRILDETKLDLNARYNYNMSNALYLQKTEFLNLKTKLNERTMLGMLGAELQRMRMLRLCKR